MTKETSGSSLGVILPPGNIWQCLETAFYSYGGATRIAQCTGQPPTQQNILGPQTATVLRLKTPRGCYVTCLSGLQIQRYTWRPPGIPVPHSRGIPQQHSPSKAHSLSCLPSQTESLLLYIKIPKNLLNEREGKAQFKGLNRLC